MKYICWVENCKEDLTEKVEAIKKEKGDPTVRMGKGKDVIHVKCSKGHDNIFEV